jgi:DNA-binding response OmpR family regulator
MAYKILLVDDDDNIRGLYADVLKEHDFEVVEAHDGEEGLRIAQANKPDLIFTGISMPNMDGFALIEKLRADKNLASVPVMISSHHGRPEDRAKAEQMGIADFVVFNFSPPAQVVKLMRFRIEGEESLHRFRIDVDAEARDAHELISSANLPKRLECTRHPGEQMVLSLTPNPEHKGEFLATFVCPRG